MAGSEDKTTVDHDVGAQSVPMRAHASLLLYLHGGVKVVPLEPEHPLVIGRAFPADVVLDDLSLSRQHARLGWQQGQLWIEDLGSTNGTHVRGERIGTRVTLSPGDTVQLGTVVASVNVTASADALMRGVIAHERFFSRLEDELLRARTFGRPLALLMVRAVTLGSGHASRWLPRVRAMLRPVDTLSLYAPNAVLALLPETDREHAYRVASSLVVGVLGEPPLVCGVASWPEARSAHELLDLARDAARGATPSSPVRFAPGKELGAGGGDEVRSVIVASPPMRELYALVRKVAASSIPVLLQGETGAGKEVVARAIHAESPRRARPLRSINCGAIPATLIESVLFGHEKGAFTGAERSAPGLFEQAEGGTVMLDEVGELSPAAQAALLRVLETKRVTRVGSVEEIACDVRVIAATHRDLEQMVAAGTFRRDLLYRLNAMTLRVPPLRERLEEIDVLADLFLEEACRANGLAVRGFDERARALLRSYPWPGNVRELRNVIERAVLVATFDVIRAEDLGERLTRVEPPTAVAPPGSHDADPDADFKDRVRQYETELILEALRRAGGNQTQAAKILRMPLRTLVHKMRSHGIRKLWSGGDDEDPEGRT